jgi:hypothetical protein
MVQNSGTEFFMYDNELVSLLNAVPVPEYYGVKVNKNPVDNPDNDTATKDPNLPWDPDKISVGGGGGGGYDNIVRPADKSLKSKS